MSLHPFVQMISSEPLQLFLTKLGMVVYYHKMECQTEKLVHCLQCQGHGKGLLKKKKKTFSSISSEPLVHLQPNLG